MASEQAQVGTVPGSLSDVVRDADVFIGVSRAGVLSVQDVKNMAPDCIVFAMANPDPEIDSKQKPCWSKPIGSSKASVFISSSCVSFPLSVYILRVYNKRGCVV